MKPIIRMLCTLLALILVLSVCTFPASAAAIFVTVDGTPVSYTSGAPFQAWNGSVMIPVAKTMEVCGAYLTQDTAGDTIVQLGSKEVRLSPDSSVLIVNGSPVDAPDAAVLSGGILYAPAAELVTGLGGYCTFRDGTLAIVTQNADSAVARLENGKALDWSNTYKLYQDGNQNRQNGNYTAAAANYEKCIPGFVGDNGSLGLCFMYLGVSYARTGAYDKAAAAYARAAYYWDLAGDDQTAIINRTCDSSIRPDISVYLKTTDLSVSKETTHGVNYEPVRGTVLGYTTDNFNLNDLYPAKSAKQAGMWLIYYHWGVHSVAEKLSYVPDNVVVELGVEPHCGVENVKDSDIIAFAQQLHTCGKKVMVRYANEMNDSSAPWFRSDPEIYKAGYIRFAKLMRTYAPEVPLIWAPNFFPPNTVDSYYPGDAYVDYVGVSSYIASYRYSAAEIDAGYDVLGTGTKLQRWSRQIDFLYNHYGYKKPIIISEGAASRIDQNTGADTVASAAAQIRDFYTYLTIRYPNLKYAVYFNLDLDNTRYMMTTNDATVGAYNAAISDARYLSDFSSTASYCYVPMDTFNYKQPVPNIPQQLCAHVSYGDNSRLASVRYEINDQLIGTATEAPYRVECDFSRYFGTAKLRVSALDAAGNVLTSRTSILTVGGMPDVDSTQFYALPVGWAVAHKITTGTSAYTFAPNDTCTRGQIVTFLWRAAGCPEPDSSRIPFTDVKPDDFFCKAVLWAVENGITYGTSATTFEPNQGCTRGQVVTFLYRAAKSPAVSADAIPFTDVPSDAFYYTPVVWALENHITSGTSATTFAPNEICTRGQIVTFLYRAR